MQPENIKPEIVAYMRDYCIKQAELSAVEKQIEDWQRQISSVHTLSIRDILEHDALQGSRLKYRIEACEAVIKQINEEIGFILMVLRAAGVE